MYSQYYIIYIYIYIHTYIYIHCVYIYIILTVHKAPLIFSPFNYWSLLHSIKYVLWSYIIYGNEWFDG